MMDIRVFDTNFAKNNEDGVAEFLSASDNGFDSLVISLEDCVGDTYGSIIVDRDEMKLWCQNVLNLIELMERS